MGWPVNNPHYADYIFYAGTGLGIATDYTFPTFAQMGYFSTEALVLRDPSNHVVAISEKWAAELHTPYIGRLFDRSGLN